MAPLRRPRQTARPGIGAEHDLVRRFAEAFTTDDIDTLVTLLTDDAWLAMPPAPHGYHGGTAIAAFLRASAATLPGLPDPRLGPGRCPNLRAQPLVSSAATTRSRRKARADQHLSEPQHRREERIRHRSRRSFPWSRTDTPV
ncbi:nuclear transport factor 2 family protein [Actinoallomurus acanthiterrae]